MDNHWMVGKHLTRLVTFGYLIMFILSRLATYASQWITGFTAGDSMALILLLPSELKHHIATELSSPGSLAALARTHTAFQREAERALYHTLSAFPRKDSPLRCLETLVANSEKAALVRSLMMECTRDNPKENQKALTCLVKVLINMHFLSDFRLRMRPDVLGTRFKDPNKRIKNLNRILCGGHFRLKTLYCDDVLDISRIIESQTELRILGIHPARKDLLKPLKRFHDAQLSLPIIFTLRRKGVFAFYIHISIFASLYSVDRSATIHQLLIKSFEEGRGDQVSAEVDKVDALTIYLIDSSDMPTIHALAKGMAVSFPRIRRLYFRFERRCEIPPQKIKEVLSFFSNLREVEFCLWPGNNGNLNLIIPEDIKISHIKTWEVACPGLVLVTFIDGSTLWKKEAGWTVFS